MSEGRNAAAAGQSTSSTKLPVRLLCSQKYLLFRANLNGSNYKYFIADEFRPLYMISYVVIHCISTLQVTGLHDHVDISSP